MEGELRRESLFILQRIRVAVACRRALAVCSCFSVISDEFEQANSRFQRVMYRCLCVFLIV